MARLTLGLLVTVIATGFAACSSPATPSLADHPDVKEAQKHIPFSLVLPGAIPDGFSLNGIGVHHLPVGDQVTVELGFRGPAGVFVRDSTGKATRYGDDPPRSFSITESNGKLGNQGQPVAIEGREAEYLEVERSDAVLRSLAFRANDEVWVVITSLSLSKAEMMAIAASMIQ